MRELRIPEFACGVVRPSLRIRPAAKVGRYDILYVVEDDKRLPVNARDVHMAYVGEICRSSLHRLRRRHVDQPFPLAQVSKHAVVSICGGAIGLQRDVGIAPGIIETCAHVFEIRMLVGVHLRHVRMRNAAHDDLDALPFGIMNERLPLLERALIRFGFERATTRHQQFGRVLRRHPGMRGKPLP